MSRNRPQGNTSMIARASARAAEQKRVEEGGKKLREVPVEQIVPNPHQPRRVFDEKTLEGLAKSIATKGLIQPITVWQTKTDQYQLIAGERRWRACQIAGLPTITAIVRAEKPDEAAEALIENLVREDLDVVEEATAIAKLLDEHGMQQDEVAAMLGTHESEITRSLKILRLPNTVLEEFPDFRQRVSRAQMVAIAEAQDEATALKLWAMAKDGLSSTAIREARKTAGQGGKASSSEKFIKGFRAFDKVLKDLPAEPITLEDEDRATLREMRDRIDALLQAESVD
ncbi:ParB/RepB/Spo0J family partition protein [Azospirillum brasilense]|nr:ParB/RepB/Spo0J family partition protein [Azospirillum brasilense]